jgi:hypothetical protein
LSHFSSEYKNGRLIAGRFLFRVLRVNFDWRCADRAGPLQRKQARPYNGY